MYNILIMRNASENLMPKIAEAINNKEYVKACKMLGYIEGEHETLKLISEITDMKQLLHELECQFKTAMNDYVDCDEIIFTWYYWGKAKRLQHYIDDVRRGINGAYND